MKLSEAQKTGIPDKESPHYVRLSLAAAMTLGFTRGWFYRNARLKCINLLLTYSDGCRANCAFCGIAAEKGVQASGGSFIRVPWRVFHADEVIEAMKSVPEHVVRVCISMITNARSRKDVLSLCTRVAKETGLPVSLLISPTVLQRDDLTRMKDAGADRVGVAIDAATPEIFERLRGKPVGGPHRWERYWDTFEHSVEIFGHGMAGVHLICGLGETERELVSAMSKAGRMGGCTHLFSFFPEKGSAMENHPAPPLAVYRRIQLARWLIDSGLASLQTMDFDSSGRITSFGVPAVQLEQIIRSGAPFETSGCPGPDGRVACNRPYGNEKPGQAIRNFPFSPEPEDVERILQQINDGEIPGTD